MTDESDAKQKRAFHLDTREVDDNIGLCNLQWIKDWME